MLELVPDVNIQGQFQLIESIMRSAQWVGFWNDLHCETVLFRSLGLTPKAKDDVVWKAIRERDAILITANRKSDGPRSLGAMLVQPDALLARPVFTISDPGRIHMDRDYTHRIAVKLFEYLYDIEDYRGVGRLYLP